MRKVMLGAAVFLMAFVVLLWSCNKQGRGGGPNDVRLKMLIAWNGGYRTPKDQYNNHVAKAIREKIGVTVEFEGIMMGETEKLNLMFASGDMPDIINAPYWGGDGGETAVIKKAAMEGRLAPIEKYLDKYPNIKRAYNIGVISQTFLEKDLAPPEFNGHLYLIPQETTGDPKYITNWCYGVFVRGDVPKALGIDERSIKTPQQLMDFMIKARDYKFKDVNGNNCIVATTGHNGWDLGQYLQGFYYQKPTGYFLQPDGSLTSDLLSKDFIDRHLFVWRMVKEGILDKECFRHSSDQADVKLGNGTGLFFAAQYDVGIKATKQTGLYNNYPEMRYVPVGPMNDKGGQPLKQYESMGRTGSPAIFLNAASKNLDAAMRYIDFINTPEGMTLARYGIEGETFERNSAGQPRLLPDLLERKMSGDASWENTLRDVGGNDYICSRLWYDQKFMEWFGEDPIGNESSAVQELDDYKELRPVVQRPGYPLSEFEQQFPGYARYRAAIIESNLEQAYRERAYFATTEAEARNILLEFQNSLRTRDNGIYLELLQFLAGKVNSRADIIY